MHISIRRASLRIVTNIFGTSRELPNWNPSRSAATTFAKAGSTAVQEIAHVRERGGLREGGQPMLAWTSTSSGSVSPFSSMPTTTFSGDLETRRTPALGASDARSLRRHQRPGAAARFHTQTAGAR